MQPSVVPPTWSHSRLKTTCARLAFALESDVGGGDISAPDTIVGTEQSPAEEVKKELLSLASATTRGFSATSAQRKRASELCNDLARQNPSANPASAYYPYPKDNIGETRNFIDVDQKPTLAGKWTLVYTDAPDITTLDGGPFALAKLGRIGQECNPPFINNVIEWIRPTWAGSLPFSGNNDSRVLQKVCTEGKADPKNPKVVDLTVVGLDLLGFRGDSNSEGTDTVEAKGLGARIKEGGLPAGLLEANPIKLRGPLSGAVPFGKFEILYLDDDLRIIRTGQNYLAVNVRGEEWF